MQTSFSELEYASKKKLTRRDRFWPRLRQSPRGRYWSRRLDRSTRSSEAGVVRRLGLGRMLRMYIAQQCFGLSDEGIEDALYDSQAIRRFVGIDLGRDSAPDATTLLNFRHLLESHHLTESIFNAINGHLAEKGLF